MSNLQERLERACERINTPAFIADDPVQFPHRFEALADVELAALLASVIAWGKRQMIIRDGNRLLDMMDNRPLDYLMSRRWQELDPQLNIHRTCFARHLQYLLRGLYEVYSRHGSLQAFAASIGADKAEAPSWHLIDALGRLCRDLNHGDTCPEVIPSNLQSTALKRYNMALRWLVRDDGKVDLGAWSLLRPAQLFIPLDVHVANTSRALGLLSRKSNDRKAVELLTARLRDFDPTDPVKYDFALFGIGIEESKLQ
ncbi:MAG: TIGR02757 family protein [Bacteroidales bacterium]|nr:TIGR02757 family protein [Bacteroidales bacterium]